MHWETLKLGYETCVYYINCETMACEVYSGSNNMMKLIILWLSSVYTA